MFGRREAFAAAGAVVLCAAVLLTFLPIGRPTLGETAVAYRPTAVVDAGHGDFDGGAVAADGTEEKTINLAIANDLCLFLTLCGFDVTPTRTDDTTLCADNDASIRERKVSDMKARLALFEQADINVSIHQNMFGGAAYHGAQVFYSENNALSKLLGTTVREEILRLIQPDNTRELKTGNRDIYLLHKSDKPTVLVECGFMSNAEELEKLKSAAYQQQMAFAVSCGVMRYYAQKGGGR